MILSRRRTHRGIFSVLALALPTVFALALALRPQTPPPTRLPAMVAFQAHLARDRKPGGPVVGRAAALVRGVTFAAETRATAGGLQVDLIPGADIQKPEVLVYWRAAGAAPKTGGLPAGSILLGRLAGSAQMRLFLPTAARPDRLGHLLLYSLAHHDVLGEIPLSGRVGTGAPR